MIGASLPSGRLTFLFTDIQGSTQLWDAFPDEMRAALKTHDEIVDEAVRKADGWIVKNTGDGIFAVFESAVDAVRAAVDAQAMIAAFEWEAVIGSLEVRMALHTDDAEASDGDYHGTAINRVARIEAAGHGGQILMSQAACDEVSGSLPDYLAVIDLGTHRLRGLSRPETIHQLVGPGLRSAFPPLRTTSVATGHLPEFTTTFVGRKTEIDSIITLLANPDCRVVTVIGPGGIGKTRLSVEAARRRSSEAGAVGHFVPLAGVSSTEGIVREIAATLNFTIDLHISSAVDETTQVMDLLQHQRMVLVLDNFEHLVDGAPLLTRLVETAPEVDLLVTSRERLGIGSEWVYELGGMSVDHHEQESEATLLFHDRARRAGASPLPPSMTRDVVDLCETLGGMPLAIELAAAWMPVLSPSEIASEVKASLDFLSATLTDRPERHRSIRAAFDQSWKRLEPDLQAIFLKLSFFPSAFTRQAAVAVAGATTGALLALLNKSLIRRADLDTYDIHPLLREYGLERLGVETEPIRRAHAEYYLERLFNRAEQLEGSIEQLEVKDELVGELENLRTASRWAVDNLSSPSFIAMLNILQDFYFLHSWVEAIGHFETLAADIEARLGHERALDDDRYLWAKTLAIHNASEFGDIDKVSTELTPLLPHWEQRGGAGLAGCLHTMGIAAEQAGELDRARSLLERAASIGFEGQRTLELGHAAWYGWVLFEQGEVDAAERVFRKGLDIANQLNTYPGRAYLLSKLGVAADGQGLHSEAAQYHHESREIFVKTGDLGGQGYTLSRLSWSYWSMGDYAMAKRYAEEGLQKFEEINHRWGISASWCRVGMAELGLGETERAATAFLRGLDLSLKNRMQTLVYYALMGMGRVNAARGRVAEAAKLLAHNVQTAQNPYADLARQALDELGDEATAELKALGASLSLDEAIALARSN